MELPKTSMFSLPICDAELTVSALRRPEPELSDLRNCGAVSALLLNLITSDEAKALTARIKAGDVQSMSDTFWADVITTRLFRDTNIRVNAYVDYSSFPEVATVMLPQTAAMVLGLPDEFPPKVGHWFVVAKRSNGSLVILDNQFGRLYDTAVDPDAVLTYSAALESEDISRIRTFHMNVVLTREELVYNAEVARHPYRSCLTFGAENLDNTIASTAECLNKSGLSMITFVDCQPDVRFEAWKASNGALCNKEKRIGCAVNVVTFLDMMTRQTGETLVREKVDLLESRGEYQSTSFEDVIEFVKKQNSVTATAETSNVVVLIDTLERLTNGMETLQTLLGPGECTIVRVNRQYPDPVGHTLVIGKSAEGILGTYDPQTEQRRERTSPDFDRKWFINSLVPNRFVTMSLLYVRTVPRGGRRTRRQRKQHRRRKTNHKKPKKV